MSATWDILIATIAHRTDSLTELLGELERQLVPGVGVRVFRDNRENNYGRKVRALIESSSADYVSSIDDDDWIAPDFVQTIATALAQGPDQVGFRVRYTEDGREQLPVVHTLKAGGWFEQSDGFYRDLTQFNPLRRELALRAGWSESYLADRQWANQLREQDCVKTEVFVDRELYHYRHRSTDGILTSAFLEPLRDPPPRPEFAFVTWL